MSYIKPLIFFGCVAVMNATTSCTSNDTVNEADERQTNVIAFNTGMNSSRSINSIFDLTKFFVYGVQSEKTLVFDHQPVDRTADGWSYSYSGGDKPTWVPGAKYEFYAYSAENSDLSGNVHFNNTDGLTFSGVCVGTSGSNFDLLYAEPIEQYGKQTANSRVAFKFSHILSQINFIFNNDTENNDNASYAVTVTNVKLSGHKLCGYFDGKKWSVEPYATQQAGYTNLLFQSSSSFAGISSPAFALGDSQQTIPLHVIPQASDDDVTLQFTYTITNNTNAKDTVSKSYSAVFKPDWEQANRYNYTINISLSQLEHIELTGESLDNWNDLNSTQFINVTEVSLGDY